MSGDHEAPARPLPSAWDALPPTNEDEALVGDYRLPDLLETTNGETAPTPSDWEAQRRPQLMRLLAQYQFGETPAQTPEPVFDVIEQDAPVMEGRARRSQVRIRFAGSAASPVIRVALHVPEGTEAPTPTLLHMGFKPNLLVFDDPGIDEGSAWDRKGRCAIPDRDADHSFTVPVDAILSRGMAIATVYYGDICPDFDHGASLGVQALFPGASDRSRPDAWGAIGAWAWGASRVLDWLETQPAVDAGKVALTGVSRLGKAALWACAQDRRFAMAIPWLSGKGGDALLRRNFGETLADLTHPSRFAYWFAPRFQDHAFRVDALPVDAHMLLAMIAPRPVLQIVGAEDSWADPRGAFLAAQAAAPAWSIHDRHAVAQRSLPRIDTPMLGDTGLVMHGGGHDTLPVDFDAIGDFMQMHFRR